MKAFSASAAILRLNLPRCNWVTGQVNGFEHTGSAVYQSVFAFVAHTDWCANASLAGSTSGLAAFSLVEHTASAALDPRSVLFENPVLSRYSFLHHPKLLRVCEGWASVRGAAAICVPRSPNGSRLSRTRLQRLTWRPCAKPMPSAALSWPTWSAFLSCFIFGMCCMATLPAELSGNWWIAQRASFA